MSRRRITRFLRSRFLFRAKRETRFCEAGSYYEPKANNKVLAKQGSYYEPKANNKVLAKQGSANKVNRFLYGKTN